MPSCLMATRMRSPLPRCPSPCVQPPRLPGTRLRSRCWRLRCWAISRPEKALFDSLLATFPEIQILRILHLTGVVQFWDLKEVMRYFAHSTVAA